MPTYNDNVLPDVDVRVDDGRVDDGALPDKNVIPNLEREECDSLAELLERWPDHGFARDDAVSADSDVGKIASDDRVTLDDVLAVQDDILGSTEDGLPGDTVARGLGKERKRIIQRTLEVLT